METTRSDNFHRVLAENKPGAFLINQNFNESLAIPKQSLSLRKVMDDGKVLIVNLSKGSIGEHASD